MNGLRRPMLPTTSSRITKSLLFCAASVAFLVARSGLALAQLASTGQAPISAQMPGEPPWLPPPPAGALPTGAGMLSVGQWLLTPTLGLYTLEDTNIHSSPVAPLSGPGFHIHPSLLADLDSGIYDTQLYANLDSKIYPTLDPLNNTFDRQAGVVQKYSPLPDLIFTAHGDYTHLTNAYQIVSSISSPVSSPATPPPTGAAGVIASQQTIVAPNDTYTATVDAYKQLNRAFVDVGGSVLRTQYETGQFSSFNFDRGSYYGKGGFWFTPILYAFADGIDADTLPDVFVALNSFRARGGIGTAPIGLFQGMVYYGWQGTEIAQGGGTAGGDIYGGAISYFPTDIWTMSASVDRLQNISHITTTVPFGIGGLPLAAIGILPNFSSEVTTVTYRSTFTFSPQTSAFGLISVTPIQFLGLRTDYSVIASLGVRHKLRDNLTLTFDYYYTRYISSAPDFSFVRNLVSVGAIYAF